MEKVINNTMLLLLLLLLQSISVLTEATTTATPTAASNFSLNYIQQNLQSCSFTVTVTTSCSSTVYTRDQISLAFGDAYGNQVYAPRLDDPSSGTFERCSSDSFHVTGPCTYQVCYAYFYRSGYDGWKPESVTISGYNTRQVTFFLRTFIPGDLWYGVNLCSSTSSGHQTKPVSRWFGYGVLGSLVAAYLQVGN